MAGLLNNPFARDCTGRLPKRSADRIAAAAAVLIAVAGTAAGQQIEMPEGGDLVADSFSYEGGTSNVNFEGLRLSQGDLALQADEATSSNFGEEVSEWQLRGDVQITVGTTRIEGSAASFTLTSGELSALELRGDPAVFEDLEPPRSEVAKGGADLVTYDSGAGTLSLLGNAWLQVGANNEWTGCDLIYDINAGTFMSGSTDCDQPFRIRIAPPPEESAAEDSPGPP